MKNRYITLKLLCHCLLPAALCLDAWAQGTAFTYQGFLTDQGAPATGSNDLTFTLFTTSGGSSVVGTSNVVNDLTMTNGLFTTTLDFGAGVFTGPDRWLQIAVRPGASSGPYTNVTPRQRVFPAPYAIFAGSSSNLSGTLAPGGLSGTYGNPLTFSNAANSIRGTFTGNGAGVSNVNATALNGLPATAFWQLGGNNVSVGQTLGSTNNQAIELVVNGFTALRLEPNSMASPNFLGGRNHLIAAGVYAATIGGGSGHTIDIGSTTTTIGGGQGNNIESNAYSATISGGSNNRIRVSSPNSVIAGGESNTVGTNSVHAFLGSGLQNGMQGNNAFSTIGGGNANTHLVSAAYGFIGGGRNITNGAPASGTIAGGENNMILAGADRAFIGGGLGNVVSGAGGMVLGGVANTAGQNAFASGRRAKATHLGSFVWGDNNNADLLSSANNQVTMRASGGYRFFSDVAATVGAAIPAGGNAWAPMSDRNVKENFEPVDCRALLEKVVAMPVTTWNLKTQPPEIRHIGAMAQDFKAAFAVGEDDRHISTSDADGVAFAAIQGLNQKTEVRSRKSEARIQKLEAENAELKRRLDSLEKIILNQSSN